MGYIPKTRESPSEARKVRDSLRPAILPCRHSISGSCLVDLAQLCMYGILLVLLVIL